MWHVTCDMWHVTCDTWHVTNDMWHVTRLGGWTFSQNVSSLALTVCDLWYYEDLEEKTHGLNQLINESVNDEAVYRTAPATPGMLKRVRGPFLISRSFWTHLNIFAIYRIYRSQLSVNGVGLTKPLTTSLNPTSKHSSHLREPSKGGR